MNPQPNTRIETLLHRILLLLYGDETTLRQQQSQELAEALGIQAPAFSNYIHGKRTPSTKQQMEIAKNVAEKLATVPLPELRERLMRNNFRYDIGHGEIEKELLRHLAIAGGKPEPSSGDLAYLRYFERDGKSCITTIDYGLFSGHSEALFDVLFRRLSYDLGVQSEPVARTAFNIEAGFERGESTIALCLFAVAARMYAKFLIWPFRISLNGFVDARAASMSEAVARALAKQKQDYRPRQLLKPIVVRGEVGYLHCVNTLGFQENDKQMIVLPQLELEEVLKALEGAMVDWTANAPVPVVVMDEYTCIRAQVREKEAIKLVLPFTTHHRNQTNPFRREMPLYYMSIACSRKEKELISLLEDILPLHFSTEVETSARAVASTFWKLEQTVYEAAEYTSYWQEASLKSEQKMGELERRVAAREYAMFTLSLNAGASKALPPEIGYWAPILERARQIIHEETIESHFNCIQDLAKWVADDQSTKAGEISKRWRLLSRYLDLDMPMPTEQLRGLSVGELSIWITRRLKGANEADEVLVVSDHDIQSLDQEFGEDEVWLSTYQLMNEIGLMYKRLPNACDQLERAIPYGEEIAKGIGEEMKDRFNGYERLFLAHLERGGNTHKVPAGILFARKFASQPRAVEFRYLWVNELARGRHVARRLIAHAVRWSRRQVDENREPKYTKAYMAVLPQLHTAMTRILRSGFALERIIAADATGEQERYASRALLSMPLDPSERESE